MVTVELNQRVVCMSRQARRLFLAHGTITLVRDCDEYLNVHFDGDQDGYDVAMLPEELADEE